jgi:hypothetical protein
MSNSIKPKKTLKIVSTVLFVVLAAYLVVSGMYTGVYKDTAAIPQHYTVETDDKTPYVIQPHLNATLRTTGPQEKKYHVITNEEGLRSPQLPEKFNQSQKTTVVVGDSMTFGWGLNRSSRFTNKCEEELQKQAPSTNIVNAGMPGYGMKDYKLMIQERIVDRNPDTVVVMFSHSDLFSASDSRTNGSNTLPGILQIIKKRWILSSQKVSESRLPSLMDEIAQIGRENDVEVKFMSYWPFSKNNRNYLQEWAKKQPGTEFKDSPNSFQNESMRDYIFSKKDPHLTPEANKKLSETLCKAIR